MRLAPRASVSLLALAGILCTIPFSLAPAVKAAGRTNWLQFSFDPQKTGNNPEETLLSPATVGGLTQIFAATTTGRVDGTPVLLTDVVTPTGTRDVLYYETRDGGLGAMDARTGDPLWSKTTTCTMGGCQNNSSPAIDPNLQFVYLYGQDGAIHKYRVGDGSEVTGGGFPARQLAGDSNKSRPALAFATAANGHTYIYGAGGSFDPHPQGHITATDLATGTQHTFNFVCSNIDGIIGTGGLSCGSSGAGIWTRGGVAYSPGADLLYTSTAEWGSFGPPTKWSQSALGFAPDGSHDRAPADGRPVTSYTPTNYQSEISSDTDLGGAGPVAMPDLPGSPKHYVMITGKDRIMRICNAADMNNTGHAGATGGCDYEVSLGGTGNIYMNPAVWTNPSDGSVWIIQVGLGGYAGLKYSISGAGKPTTTQVWSHAVNGPSSVAVANGVAYFCTGGATFSPGAGNLLAVDIQSGNTLFSGPHGCHHWSSPIVANGMVYYSDGNTPSIMYAYGLPNQPTPTATATGPTPTATITATATLTPTATIAPTPTSTPMPGTIRINSGGGAASPFVADVDFVGGTAATNWTGAIDTSAVTNPAPPAVYQAERYGASTYTIPGYIPGNSATIRLHFCENFFTATGKRVFNVSINGTAAVTNFDIFATTGAIHKAVVKEVTATANGSGQFVIQLANVTNNALINGIEVIPGFNDTTPTTTPTPTITPTMTPTATPTIGSTATATATATTAPTATPTPTSSIKINSGGGAASPFVADMDFAGGTAATNWTGATDTSAVTNPAPQAVYQAERYGASTYTIPGYAAASSHIVRLHMCENYFTAAGKRKFNVSINGTAVLTGFDIFATTGAAHKATIQEFTVAANASGQYVVQLTNVTNNALINGVEIN